MVWHLAIRGHIWFSQQYDSTLRKQQKYDFYIKPIQITEKKIFTTIFSKAGKPSYIINEHRLNKSLFYVDFSSTQFTVEKVAQ